MKTIFISGNLNVIQIYGKNQVALIIIDMDGWGEVSYRIECDNEFTKFIRENILPMTGIEVEVTEISAATYKLNRIVRYNLPLLFGHYICPRCGRDYGINEFYKDKWCELCIKPTKLEYITDFTKNNV